MTQYKNNSLCRPELGGTSLPVIPAFRNLMSPKLAWVTYRDNAGEKQRKPNYPARDENGIQQHCTSLAKFLLEPTERLKYLQRSPNNVVSIIWLIHQECVSVAFFIVRVFRAVSPLAPLSLCHALSHAVVSVSLDESLLLALGCWKFCVRPTLFGFLLKDLHGLLVDLRFLIQCHEVFL